jgi:Domain of unknown function (DUF1877)
MMQTRRGPVPGKHGVLSLDKHWHGLHYVLCGAPEPGSSLMSQIVLGGEEIGEDLGYGPARYFTPAQVAEMAQALSGPEVEEAAAARFDPERMSEMEIYPGWRAGDRDSVMALLRELRDFYAQAAARGWAVVTCIV